MAMIISSIPAPTTAADNNNCESSSRAPIVNVVPLPLPLPLALALALPLLLPLPLPLLLTTWRCRCAGLQQFPPGHVAGAGS